MMSAINISLKTGSVSAIEREKISAWLIFLLPKVNCYNEFQVGQGSHLDYMIMAHPEGLERLWAMT
jgi:hypothetical protein